MELQCSASGPDSRESFCAELEREKHHDPEEKALEDGQGDKDKSKAIRQARVEVKQYDVPAWEDASTTDATERVRFVS